jgi:hypothetical protein
VVYPKQQIPGLEEEWLPVMGPRKSYAFLSLSIFTCINLVPDHAAGAGKSILWCAVSQLLLCQKIHILDELRYY